MTTEATTEPSNERTSFGLRFLRAALLHADTYEEVEADPKAIRQAWAIVLAVSVLAGAGTWLRIQNGHPLPESAPPLPVHLMLIVLEPLAIWLISSVFTYMVGATFLRGPETETDYAEVLRTTGFAFAPGILLFFVWLPPAELGLGMWSLARLWILVAAVVAVRQALDFTTLRAVATFGLAAVLMWLVLWGLSVAPVPLP